MTEITRFFARPLLVLLLLNALVFGFVGSDSQTSAEAPAVAVPPPAAITQPLFPDKALEAAVRREVFSKRDNQEPLTSDDVAAISRIEAPRQGIRNLEGLQHCRALLLIDVADNDISDLTPLAELRRLQSVTLAGNQIRDLSPLVGLSAIQLLDLSRNKVEKLDAIGKMPNLRALYLADNRIGSITPLASLSKIGSLDIAGNAIEDLSPISEATWLTTLEISNNRVATLAPLVGLSELSMLIMPDNPLESLNPLVEMCVRDARPGQRSGQKPRTDPKLTAPFFKIYLNLQSDAAKKWQGSIEKLKQAGVSIHDYRRPNAARPTP